MSNRQIIITALVIVAGYFLYEPVMDRFFTDTSIKVSEASSPFPDDEQELHLETSRLALTLSPYGGRITSARLKEFTAEKKQPVELISSILETRAGIRLDIPNILDNLDDQPYRYSVDNNGVEFIQELPGNLEIIKSYHTADEYSVTIDLAFTNHGPETITLPEGYRIIPFFGMDTGGPDEAKDQQVVWLNGLEDGVQRQKIKAIKEPIVTDKPVSWVGIHNRYFAQILIPQSKEHTLSLHPLGDWQLYATLATPALSLAPGQTHQDSYRLYLGPLAAKDLRAEQAGLEKMMNYGSFEFLGKGVVLSLKCIRQYIANYGLCLILLALLLRLLLLPVTHYNLKSLREMPLIQHEIYRIEDEQPTEAEELIPPLRKKLNKAMVGSFLPLAIQVPIFLALYQALNSSIELRQASLGMWITDLSAQDPYFVLPVLMGLAMIFQQRLTTVNPQEDKTWIWMPVGFTLFFAFFPAGLVLFWLADSLFSVAQLSFIATKSGVGKILAA